MGLTYIPYLTKSMWLLVT